MIELIRKLLAICESRKMALTYHMTPNNNIRGMLWHYDTIGTLFLVIGSFFDPWLRKIKGTRGERLFSAELYLAGAK